MENVISKRRTLYQQEQWSTGFTLCCPK